MSESPIPAVGGANDADADERGAVAASPAAEPVEAVGGLEPTTRRALYALLSSLADNKYVLGRRYAEWCTGAPLLESAVAAAAMAQDELGHARSFYPLLRGFPEASATDTAEEAGWQTRPTSAMAFLDNPFHGWHDFIAANVVIDTALTALFESATESSYEPLRQRARKIVQEEAAHWIHGEGWLRRIAADEAQRPALVASLGRVWDDAMTWFGKTDDETLARLGRADILASRPDAMRQRLRARLVPVLEAAGLAEVADRDLPWDRWDAAARRLGPAA